MRQKLAFAAVAMFVATALATAGSRARTTPPDVRYFPADAVAAAFAKGAPLLEQFNYKIHASRREAPGMVEIHAKDTDIIHVLDGTATFVTGGEIVGAKTTAPDEIRGSDVTGGSIRTLSKGDVVVVPAGTPHWFKAVQGPFLYYVVKVSEGR